MKHQALPGVIREQQQKKTNVINNSICLIQLPLQFDIKGVCVEAVTVKWILCDHDCSKQLKQNNSKFETIFTNKIGKCSINNKRSFNIGMSLKTFVCRRKQEMKKKKAP